MNALRVSGGRFPLDRPDLELLRELQVRFPLCERPFAEMGRRVGLGEEETLHRVRRLASAGVILRVAPLFPPEVVGWRSTLLGIKVLPGREPEVAERLAGIPWTTHLYEREDDWRIWAALVGPDDAALAAARRDVAAREDVEAVAELPADRAYKVSAVFVPGRDAPPAAGGGGRGLRRVSPEDAAILAVLATGVALVPVPLEEPAARLGIPAGAVLGRLRALVAGGAVRRFGAVVDPARLGYGAGALIAMRLAAAVDEAGAAVAGVKGVTHCYRRRPHPLFPFNLFAMAHSRGEVRGVAEAVFEAAGRVSPVGEARVMRTVRRFLRRPPAYAEVLL